MRIGTGLLIALCLSGPAVLQGIRAAAADTPAPSAAAGAVPSECRGMNAKRAHERADLAFQQARYQEAGRCYVIAGDMSRANLAFVKATAAEAPAIKRQLTANANQVKQQFRQFREAFTSR